MQRITEFIRLGFTPDLLKRVRAEAKLQEKGVNELVRNVLEKYLGEQKKAHIAEAYAINKPRK